MALSNRDEGAIWPEHEYINYMYGGVPFNFVPQFIYYRLDPPRQWKTSLLVGVDTIFKVGGGTL